MIQGGLAVVVFLIGIYMDIPGKGWIEAGARSLAYLILAGIAASAVRQLLAGVRVEGLTETIGSGSQPFSYSISYPPAIGYLAATVLIGIGLVQRKLLPLAWLGFAGLAVWSFLFLFSSGAGLVVPVGLLLIALVTITVLSRRQ